MKILIIGNGFIATSIIHRLITEGHNLLVFSRTPREDIQCEQISGDIFDFEKFMEVLRRKPEIVIHTAWITTPGLYKNDPSNYDYSKFTINLAKYLAHSDIKHLIILGTCAEYGFQNGPSVAGLTQLSPNVLYSEQKVVAFNEIKALLRESSVRFTWARVFYPYGPKQDSRRLIPLLIQSLQNNKPIALADISSIYDWISTRDIASAICWVIENEVPFEVDIGTSIGFTNLDLLSIIENLLQLKHRTPPHRAHEIGLSEVFVVGKKSPLYESGWLPKDTLHNGLEWVLSS